MTLITDTTTLAEFCQRQRGAAYLALDTEFMRERTYWPQLCLIQVASAPEDAAVIDVLADGLDLTPFWELIAEPGPVKVFHAARQDVEIIHHLTDTIPHPLFDTQIAAMVCGFGEQVGFETLVQRLTGHQLDKSSRISDWAQRPLSRRQIDYALADVVHLCPVYETLAARLAETGRDAWVREEMAVLAEPSTYVVEPTEAWRRVKAKNLPARSMGILRALAAWRERQAQARDVPRQRVLRDETLVDLAGSAPRSHGDLEAIRGLPRRYTTGRDADQLLALVEEGRQAPPTRKAAKPRRDVDAGRAPLIDLLKALLRHRGEANDVAPRLIASADELEALVADPSADLPAKQGWRYEVFGRDAMALLEGRAALRVAASGLVLEEA